MEPNDILLRISADMRSQNNRSSQYPLFVVQEKVKRYTENGNERERQDYDLADANDLCEKCRAQYDETGDYPEECDDCPEYTFVRFDWEWQTSDRAGVFLTEGACRLHITVNGYHYREPRCFAISAWRNSEMVAVIQAILKLTGDEIPSHYR